MAQRGRGRGRAAEAGRRGRGARGGAARAARPEHRAGERAARQLRDAQEVRRARAGPHGRVGAAHGHAQGEAQEGLRGLRALARRPLRGPVSAGSKGGAVVGKSGESARGRLRNLVRLPWRQRPAVGVTPADVVHAENKWRLLRYRARPSGRAFRTPVLLVPSLINRHYVLDLVPGKSFAEYMVNQGHDVFVIDWGTPADEDRFVSFDDITDRALGRALRVAASHGESGQAHVLGYCLGGILTAIHTAVRPERVASLVQLAAPVVFHDEGLLSAWMRTPSFDVDAMIDAYGNVPWQLMQSAFHLLRPTLTLSKAVGVIDRAWNDEFLDGFLALETWGNDNVSLPGEFYRRYARMYRDDELSRGTLTLSGQPARLEAIDRPLLTITFEHDNIVPWRSAAAIHERAASP
ncbi:MAG: alpha/beta fold hydrolase, partial [Myxococcales bacterium]